MDALEFLKEERRMCNSFDIGCVKCPLDDIGCCVSPEETDEEFEKEIAIVEQCRRNTRARRGRVCFWSSIRRHASEMMVCYK